MDRLTKPETSPGAIPAPLWDREAYEYERAELFRDAPMIASVYDYFEESRDECH